MHIIFGDDQAQELAKKHPVLELDTFQNGENGPLVRAFCVIENVPIPDLPRIDSMKNLHSNLMINYYKQDWNFCIQAIEQLLGYWGTEVDTFYIDLKHRIENFIETEPGSTWTGIIVKTKAPA
jgi:hypothetical protein